MNANDLIGGIGGIIGAVGGIISVYFSWDTKREMSRPKVKLTLEKTEGNRISSLHDLLLQNISTRNLYDFSIRLKEINEINQPYLKDKAYLLQTNIPVFTIGQMYTTFLVDTAKCNNVDELNFIIRYKTKPTGKIHEEICTLNINAFRNIMRKIEIN